MTKQRATLLAGLPVILAAALAAGCQPQTPPSEEAVIDYLRRVRVNGKVRRLWPKGQDYVDAIFKADAALHEELNALRELTALDSLPPRDDTCWQDNLKLAERAGELIGQLDAPRLKRQTLLRRLDKAIQETPKDLDLTAGDAKARFVTAAWTALAVQDVDLRNGDAITKLEETTEAHLALVREVWACADDFDSTRPGLAFKDPGNQEKIDRQYDALHQHLRDIRTRVIDYAEQVLRDVAPRLRTIDKQESRNEYEYLVYRGDYMVDLLEGIVKEVRKSIKDTEEKIDQLESDAGHADERDKGKLETAVELRKQHLADLEAQRDIWKPRIEAVCKRFKEESSAEQPSQE